MLDMNNKAALGIGRFAQLTGLSVRALRLYDEQGLLRPDRVDEWSGYRRYSVTQLDRGSWIARLRALDMPLDEIGLFLDAADESVSEAVLVRHRDRLADRAATTADALRSLDVLMKELAMPDQRPHQLSAMVVKTLRDQPVLRIRRTARPEDCDPAADIDQVFHVLSLQGLTQAGPPYFSAGEPDDEGQRSIESGIPVGSAGVADGEVEAAVLVGGDVASLLYRGRYEGIDAAYRQLWKSIQEAGLRPTGEPRDIYLTSPDATPDPENYLTEVLWPVIESSEDLLAERGSGS